MERDVLLASTHMLLIYFTASKFANLCVNRDAFVFALNLCLWLGISFSNLKFRLNLIGP
jgi:hypothetical protein